MKMKRLAWLSIALLLVAVLASCRSSTKTESNNTTLPGSEVLVEKAKLDLASHLNISSSAITLVSVDSVNFADTSLGVPQPGQMYAQVITPGFIIKLKANGQQYQYNTDQINTIICNLNPTITTSTSTTTGIADPTDVTIPVDPGKIMDGKPWVPAN